ncbi:MAG TPA: glycosyltransferase [Pseudoxanthomonas sp.]|nr:glycosyltransferase [Pseudoxanthomonas sp.]
MSGRDIIHVVENLARGGLERTVIDLIAAQRAAGHRCRVICVFEPGQLAGELQALGVRVDACHKRNGLDLRALRRLRAWLRETPGAVLHSHNATAHYYALLAAVGLPLARTVNTRHGMGAADPRSRKEAIYRLSARYTDYVVGVCEAARDRFAAQHVRPRAGLLAIPNGIRLIRFAPAQASDRVALARELGWPDDSVIIGTVGRLNPVKDQAALIAAFARVHAAQPQARLVIVGDGQLRDALQARIDVAGLQAVAQLVGDRDDVPRWLTGMQVFALPSRSEGYSIALLEACAAGLPIVATDVGGNREIVREGINGALIAPGDVEALVHALHARVADPELAQQQGQAGREWVLREGSFLHMAQRYDALYAGKPLSERSVAGMVEAV